MPTLPITNTSPTIASFSPSQTVPSTAFDNPIAQLFAAINDVNGYLNPAQDVGTFNAYACNLSTNPSAYRRGLGVVLSVANTNTGPSTLAIGSLPPVVIVRPTGQPLLPGDMVAGQVSVLFYDGSVWELINPKGGVINAVPIQGVIGHRLGISSGDPWRFIRNISTGNWLYWTPCKGNATTLYNTSTGLWQTVAFPEQTVNIGTLGNASGACYMLCASWSGSFVQFIAIGANNANFYPSIVWEPFTAYKDANGNLWRVIGHYYVSGTNGQVNWFTNPSGVMLVGLSDLNFPTPVSNAGPTELLLEFNSVAQFHGAGTGAPGYGSWIEGEPAAEYTTGTITATPYGGTPYNAPGSGATQGWSGQSWSTQSGGFPSGLGRTFYGSWSLQGTAGPTFLGSITGNVNGVTWQC